MFKSIKSNFYKYLILLFLFSCSGPKNYKEAYVFVRNDQTYIKLKGKREGMVHDPISILKNKLYEDSILIPITRLEDGIIEGKNIPVEEGYYKYQGYISITKQKLIVNLQIINTDDKKIEPESYNGEYTIVQK